MKHYVILLFSLFLFILASCSHNSHIPNVCILEELSPEQLSSILKADEGKKHQCEPFEDLYPTIRRQVETMSEIEKAKCADLTYRTLYNALEFANDSILTNQLHNEWQAKYDANIDRAKQIAASMEFGLSAQTRVAMTRASMNGYSLSYANAARSSDYAKYFSRIPAIWHDVPNCWDYNKIIADKIAPTFLPEIKYVGRKKLEKLKEKYPDAYPFFELQQNKIETFYDNMTSF